MKTKSRNLWRCLAAFLVLAPLGKPVAAPLPVAERPQYRLSIDVDFEVCSFRETADITVPVAPGEALRDAVFFIYANAAGVGGDDPRRKSIAVDSVTFRGQAVPFSLRSAVLRVTLPQPQTAPFTLSMKLHGVVPRAPAGAGGLADMLGGLGGLGGNLNLGGEEKKAENIDYGLYTYGGGVLSLGSFWYPQLAMRQNGAWLDEAPAGLGDVAFAQMSDYDVTLVVPEGVTVAATGNDAPLDFKTQPGRKPVAFRAENARDFAVLMSEDWVVKRVPVDVGGRSVSVESYTLKKDAAKGAVAADIAAKALQIYSRRFGPYPYSSFKVVEGTIRSGAGGMEFTGLTSIAPMLYGDWAKQLGQFAKELGGGDIGALLGGFDDDAGAKNNAPDNPAGDLLGGMLGGQMEMLNSIFEMTIAHEVAHQWWAIGVGSDSQRAPFVDESLANYTAILYFEDRYGKAKAEKMMDTHLRQTYAMGRMMGGPDRPANLRTSAYAGNVQYAAVVYGKGALYYHELRRAAGDAAFFDALRTYFSRLGGRVAGPRDFTTILKGKAPNAKVDALYARWIEGTHGDADITGGKPAGLDDLLGGLLGNFGLE